MAVIEGRADMFIRREDALRLIDRASPEVPVTVERLADAMHDEVCIPAGFRPVDHGGLKGELHRQMHLTKAQALLQRATRP